MAKQFISLLLLWLAISGQTLAEEPLRNRLAGHPSPYLALHGTDPVAWQEWNAETIARAKRENKLLFVSVGYFACHWCHVMQRESYKNREIAAHLNRDFIPVKVDRELNTGLDDALQTFSERLLRIAGWPLNAFVTPEGYPVYVILYASPEEFRGVLEKLSDRWQADSSGIEKLSRQAATEPTAPQIQKLDRNAVLQWQEKFLKQARAERDEFRGGFGQVSKFPMSPQLALLLDQAAKEPDGELAAFLKLTLDQMSAKGLRDHVGGGFFRYTVDPGWETPHFEKMLYDNAQLALIYLRAAEVFKSPKYGDIGRGALDFMIDVLKDRDGGYYTSTSAVDSQGREGTHYLWEREALAKLLSAEEYAVARRIWRLDAARPFDFGYLTAEWVAPNQAERVVLDGALKKMKKARAALSLPRDDKRNAGLNGLALSAFSAGMKQDSKYAEHAASLARFISTRLARNDGLFKAVARGKQIEGAELEDHAYVTTGLLDYAEAAKDDAAKKLALKLARQAWERFFNDKGWRREEHPLLKTIRPEAILPDGATPSPSAVLIMASLKLKDPVLFAKARQALQWQSADMARDPFAHATQILAYRRLIN